MSCDIPAVGRVRLEESEATDNLFGFGEGAVARLTTVPGIGPITATAYVERYNE